MDIESTNNEFIEMKFGPRWPYVSTIRNFMQNFLIVATRNQKLADKISMTISELVENAVRYSDESDTYLKVKLHREREGIEVSVQNHALKKEADVLLGFLKELESDTPLEAYISKMKRTHESKEKSHLGLARIRYEAGARLSAEYLNSIVTVKAWFNIKDASWT